jgi:non-homologous end joining protein Ku
LNPAPVPEFDVAPRANWKGFPRLSLVTCPVALYPATSESEKVVIRETIKEMNKIAIGRVVLTSREHIIALEPLAKIGFSR